MGWGYVGREDRKRGPSLSLFVVLPFVRFIFRSFYLFHRALASRLRSCLMKQEKKKKKGLCERSPWRVRM
jgi:hypothetical protein